MQRVTVCGNPGQNPSASSFLPFMYTLDTMTSSSSSFQMSTLSGQSIQTLSALPSLTRELLATMPHVDQLKLDIFLN